MSDRWSDLSTAAVLGTARAPVPGAVETGGGLGGLLARLPVDNPERVLLASAAAVALWRQAGARPIVLRAPIPPAAPVDERPACSPAAARCLGPILRGGMGSLLEEWLSALRAAGQVFPHRWLPEMLDLAGEKDAPRPLICSLLGERGRWLAAQRPEWQDLLIPADEPSLAERWQTGSQTTRLALLDHLRAVDPARGRALLRTTWSEERARQRAAFLATFKTGLSAGDEPWLESLLDDRSKQVRAVATALLACLSSSRLVARMEERASALLSVERSPLRQNRLQVSLPADCDPGMARDGIVEQPPSGLGKRAWWLLQMVASVPPGTWQGLKQGSPRELIEMAARSEHGGVLLEGWAKAAARHRDGAWAEALLHRWADDPWAVLSSGKPLYVSGCLPDLMEAVAHEHLEDWLTCMARARRRSFARSDELLDLVIHHRRQWGPALTRVILDGLRVLATEGQSSPRVWRWRAALPDFAHTMDPALAVEAEQGWPENRSWTRQVDRFLTTLRFRREMLAAFDVAET